MIRADFHTHTTYCDGKNTPEEMVNAAISRGMTALGLSGHSYTAHDGFGMDAPARAAFRSEVFRLKAEYAGKLEIFLGLEQDILSPAPKESWDYLIGSVHTVWKDGCAVSVDGSPEEVRQAIATLYGGDACAYVEDYYRAVSDVAAVCRPDIIGHFDLISKFNENGVLFDENHPRCRAAALDALHALLPAGIPFEINTGAIRGGWRTQPYPAPFLLKEIRAAGGRIILSSDAHDCGGLLFGFRQAANLAVRCGFSTALILTRNGFCETVL